MSPLIFRSRFVSLLKNRHGRLMSSDLASTPSKDAINASQKLISDQIPPDVQGPTGSSSSSSSTTSKPWNFLKYSLIGALTGATAVAGYASYAYSYDEIEEKAKALRRSASHTAADDASGVEKVQGMLYSTIMSAPAKLIDVYLDLRKAIEEQVKGYTEPNAEMLLPELHPMERHVFTLVLDLNETLVYSDWTRERGWQTFKRPGVDSFLEHLAQFYEIVIYSDQSNMYVDPVIDRLDPKHCIRYRLSRAATKYENGKHYRDLSKLNRDPRKIIYLSGHALDSSLQPENSVPIKPWKCEADDTALLDFIPFLEFVARNSPADIRQVLESYKGCDIPTEFIRRSKEHQRRIQEQKQQGRIWKR
ncbi:mitochondrial import inner membrane translocase subunit TIM50 [Cucurbita pepo subsp. pepo]|uniref:mitochondrial import inner membrane translocase subunit TIM50 n=1 Tax=Cucurbita pepo subsp. pepo TaxID=3664 RepID=UPI000C9D5B79|nr:mitochondrial import inner membrane translocase subunit TIM50 [Cucurbita pepo subsp. pepo]